MSRTKTRGCRQKAAKKFLLDVENLTHQEYYPRDTQSYPMDAVIPSRPGWFRKARTARDTVRA